MQGNWRNKEHRITIIINKNNNLADALSSIITIIGTKLSNKPPNKKHPYGYGGIECFTSVMCQSNYF